ncbi:MAG: restriction endonuclease subunit S [Patescibacteria group bacterium]|nr:restriction endonuclease subunit S [Patescibacteria group bacterium]
MRELFEEVTRKVGSENIDTYSITAGIGFVSQKIKFGKNISGNQNKNYTIIEPLQFSYNKGNSKTFKYGCVYLNLVGKNIAVPNVFISFKLKNEKMNQSFFAELFDAHYLDRGLKKIISSTARMDGLLNVNKDNFFQLELRVPSNPEQHKIADFLTTVDEKIEGQSKKIELLKKYKKGIVQKIFSQQIRFKIEDGKAFPDWEEVRLANTGKIITGTTPSTFNREFYGGIFPWVTPTDINDKKDISVSAKFLTKEGIEKSRFIPKNSLLVTCIASIGKNAILRSNGSCNQQINAIIPNNKFNVEFLYYLIEYQKRVLIQFAGAGGMQILNKENFSKIEFKIPTLPEQKKIADFLTSIDEKIELEERKLAEVKKFKKSLLQNMFV